MYDTTSPLIHAKVNLFADTFKPKPIKTLTLQEALERIRDGIYGSEVAALRDIIGHGDRAAAHDAKAKLPAYTFAGTFTPSRANANLQQHTGIVHGDLDDLGTLDHILDIKAEMTRHPCVVYAFVSPRMTGLKVGIRVPVVADDTAYKHAWHTVKAEFEQKYGGTWDPSGKDIARLCYVSHDNDTYINLQATRFDVPPAPPPEPKPLPKKAVASTTHVKQKDYGQRALDTATEMIQSAPMGTRHYTRLKAARLLGGYVAGRVLSYQEALAALSRALEGYTEDISGALKTIVDGLAYGEANPITIEALEAERQAWIEAHQTTPTKTPPAPIDDDPWAGMRTLPAKSYTGFRPYIRGARAHGYR